MLLQLRTTHRPATDLGLLLGLATDRVCTVPLAFGTAHVFWPEVSETAAEAVLYVEVGPEGPLRRPYVASGFLAVAIAEVWGAAVSGRCGDRPELVDVPLPLEVHLPAVAAPGGEGTVRALFEPLGYAVDLAVVHGDLLAVRLAATVPLHVLLGHLYVLVAALDPAEPGGIAGEPVETLLRHAEGWIDTHPHRDRILRLDPAAAPAPEEVRGAHEEALEARVSLAEHRFRWVMQTVRRLGARSVIDLGCGDGRLLKRLLQSRDLERVGGLDVSRRALALAHERLDAEHQARLVLIHGSLLYRDRRVKGWDLATCLEVIEHLPPERLSAFEDALFGDAAPRHVVVTTPNAAYNIRFGLSGLRHPDHGFEWTRTELRVWAERVAATHGYAAAFHDLGEVDPELGPPTCGVVFSRGGA